LKLKIISIVTLLFSTASRKENSLANAFTHSYRQTFEFLEGYFAKDLSLDLPHGEKATPPAEMACKRERTVPYIYQNTFGARYASFA